MNEKTQAKLSDNLVEFTKEAKEVWLELIKIHTNAEANETGNLVVKLETITRSMLGVILLEKENPKDIQTKNDVDQKIPL